MLFFIYRHFDNHHINYVALGNELNYSINSVKSNNYNDLVKEYLINSKKIGTFNNYFKSNTISKLVDDIKINRTIRVDSNDYYLKRLLRESDFVIVNIGEEELAYNYDIYDMEKNKVIFNNMYHDIIKLITTIKRYAKGKVLFLGYYNPTNYYDARVDEFFYNVDLKLSSLMVKNDIIYIDLYEIIKSNHYKEKNYYINTKGQEKIANLIEFYL